MTEVDSDRGVDRGVDRDAEAPAPVAAITPPTGRTAPFSRRAVAPAGVTPPQRTESGALSASPPPMAAFAGAKPVAATPVTATTAAQAPSSPAIAALDAVAEHADAVEAAEAAERQRLAALEARRAQAAERPSWFMSPPPTAPVSASPFAVVSSPEPAGPTPAELEAIAARAAAEQAAAEQAAAERAAAERAAAERAAAERAAAEQAAQRAAAEHAAQQSELRSFHDQAGATVVHPDEFRGALMAPRGPATPVVPPIDADSPAAPAAFVRAPVEVPPAGRYAESTQPSLPQPAPADPAAAPVAAPTEGLLSTRPPADAPLVDPPAKGRKGRAKRADRKARHEPTPEELAAAAAEAAEAQDAAMEAYRRFAREGTMVTEDYYRGPVAEIDDEPEPTVVIAESLIPKGRARRKPKSNRSRTPAVVALLVVAAVGGGGYYYETHQVTAPAAIGLPSVSLDETTSATGAPFTVPAAATSGASYRLTVPAGWSAVSQPTRPGGEHTDVTVTEPILGLSVTVRSDRAAAPDTVTGKPVDTALRIFGHPAGIVAPTVAANSATVSRVATVTLHGVRYSVTLTVPRASAARDYGRADAVARSLTAA